MTSQRKKQVIVLAASAAVLLVLCLVLSLVTVSGKKDDSHAFCVYFTEVMSSNSAYPDGNGVARDYVELYNSADGAVDISGFQLSDSDRSVKYTIPDNTILGAGAYYVIWCESGSDDAADFSIDKNGGETIYLMNRKNVIVDTVTTVPTERNCPMVLSGDGKTWTLAAYGTPGFENSQAGYESYLASRSAESYPVRLNEVLASNDAYPAPDGGYYDFIEVCNTTEEDVDISGCRLSDDPAEMKYTVPSGTVVPAGGYLVFWCGGEDGLPFKLSSEGGDTVCMLSPGGDVIDEIAVPAAETNISFAKQEDGTWSESAQATPGYENSDEGFSAWMEEQGIVDNTVVISEVMTDNASTLLADGAFPDWVELFNAGDTAQELTGWYLSDRTDNASKWQFPEVTLGPGEYLLVLCDGRTEEDGDYLHAGFSLSEGETVCLFNPAGKLVASEVLPAAETDCSVVFYGGAEGATEMTTPGWPNTAAGWNSFQESLTEPQSLLLSEAMTANDSVLRQSGGKYYDWVELRNNSGETLNLSGYALTDKLEDPDKYPLPDVELEDGDYYTVILSDGTLALNAEDETLYLMDADGTCIDVMHLTGIPYRCSYGRTVGEGGFRYYEEPTPGEENKDGERAISPEPTTSTEPGVYNDVDKVTVDLSGTGVVYYTTDGSLPTTASTRYEQPLELTATTVLRVINVQDGCLPSSTVSLSYIINENHVFPVISLTMDPNDFSYMYRNYYSDIENYANLTFFDTDGSGFSIDCGAKIFGSLSRETCVKKSLKIMFRSCYGQDTLNYDLFEGYDVNEFSSLVLRAGQDASIAFIREELMTSLAKEASSSLQTTQYRYSVLYINGRYWGIYAIKEAFSQEYFASHYDVPAENVKMVRVINVLTEAPELFDLMRYAVNNDLSVEENYEYMTEHIDIESLADWIIFETYCENTDVLNNVRYVMSPDLDGKWRYCFYDLDWSLRSHDTSNVFRGGEQFSQIPRGMVANAEFREYLLNRLAYHLENTLSDEHVLARIDEMVEELMPELPREFERWDRTMWNFEANLAELRDYVENPGRAREMADDYSDRFGLTAAEREELFGGVE